MNQLKVAARIATLLPIRDKLRLSIRAHSGRSVLRLLGPRMKIVLAYWDYSWRSDSTKLEYISYPNPESWPNHLLMFVERDEPEWAAVLKRLKEHP